MNANTIIIIAGLAALGVGGYLLYQHHQKNQLAQQNTSNPEQRSNSAQKVSEYANAVSDGLDAAGKVFGGF